MKQCRVGWVKSNAMCVIMSSPGQTFLEHRWHKWNQGDFKSANTLKKLTTIVFTLLLFVENWIHIKTWSRLHLTRHLLRHPTYYEISKAMHCSASGAPPTTSRTGTHFHRRNTCNPTLDAGCRFGCEPGINMSILNSTFMGLLIPRVQACCVL